MKNFKTAAGGFAVAAALLTFGLAIVRVESGSEVDRHVRQVEHAVPEPAPANAAETLRDVTVLDAPSDRDPRVRDDAATHVAVAVVDADDDALSARWDQLAPSQRREELRRQFNDAMDELATARDASGAEARADAALSALRAELYDTPQGAQEHQRLEQQLDAARAEDRS